MPPKGAGRRKAPTATATPTGGASADGTPFESVPATSVPPTPTFAESLSYLHYARPFKRSSYSKGASRRTRNLKAVLTQERERDRAEAARRRAARQEAEAAAAAQTEADEDAMQVDGEAAPAPSSAAAAQATIVEEEELPTYSSIEAPPSVLPQKHYCDITGLEAPYTDPATGLRYHDRSIYEFIKTLNPSAVKEYLALRGVNPIVK